MPWRGESEPTFKFCMGRQIDVVKRSPEYRALDKIDGEPMEFEWNIFPGFTTLQLCSKVQELLSRLSVQQKKSLDGLSSCRCSTTSHGDLKTIKKNANQVLSSFFSMRKDFSAGQWSFLGPGSENRWYSTNEYSPQGEWDGVAEQMILTFAESRHPAFRSTSPLSRGVLKRKGGGKLSIHFCADGETVETVFRTIVTVCQLSIYGAVSDVCEDYKACHVRTGRPVVAGQSNPLFVPSVMKTHIPLTDDPA